jgi:predicted nucleotidyltransferase
MPTQVTVDRARIADFCRKWQVTELALFGSVLREDFGPDSDVDVLVTFAPEVPWSLFDLVDVADELEAIFGRKVHLVEGEGLRNPIRRRAIMSSREIIHAASRPRRWRRDRRHGRCEPGGERDRPVFAGKDGCRLRAGGLRASEWKEQRG